MKKIFLLLIILLLTACQSEEKKKLIDQKNFSKEETIQRELLSIFSKDETLQSIIIDNSLNHSFIEKLNYLVNKKLHKKENYQIEKDKNYFNYFLLASLYAKDNKDTLQLYSELKSNISIELMPSFTLIVNSVGKEYEFSELLKSFVTLQKELSIDSLKELITYPQYFAYFLYPKKETLFQGTISDYQLKEIQKHIQEEVIFLYEEMFEQNRYVEGIKQMDYALLTIQNIYPYLLEQPTIEIDKFKSLFGYLIKKGYLFELFDKDKCSNETEENFALFGQKNIESMIKLFDKERAFTFNLFSELKVDKHKAVALFYIANAYKNLNELEWNIFKDLLSTLPDTFSNRLSFIQRIEQAGYFRNISIQKDYDVRISSKYSEKNQKYKYILLTPYPLQSDENLFEKSLHSTMPNKILQESLVDLIGKNKKQLEKHEFTKGEKIFGNIEKLETVTTVVSIVLVPFTGGLSLSGVALKVIIKQGTKQGVEYIKKRIIKTIINELQEDTDAEIKYLTKKILKLVDEKITSKNAKELKALKEQLSKIEIIKKSVKKADKELEKIIKKKEKTLSFFYSNNLKIKQICKEKN